MIEVTSLAELAKHKINRISIACGNFDGIHRGHRKLINSAIETAKSKGGDAIVLTFTPHPKEFFTGKKIPTISSHSQRIETLEKMGIKAIVWLKFDQDFAKTDARDFIEKQILTCSELKVTDFSVGSNWKFGAERQGDINLLKSYSPYFTTHPIEELNFEGESVSSSRIRMALAKANFELAEKLLGHKWFLSGEVIYGLGIASDKLDAPTANIDTGIQVLPLSGVFAVHAKIDEQIHRGLLNIGHAPTFSEKQQEDHHVELYLLDFSGNLYGKKISIHFEAFLRKEKKFNSHTDLKNQIIIDEQRARQIFEA